VDCAFPEMQYLEKSHIAQATGQAYQFSQTVATATTISLGALNAVIHVVFQQGKTFSSQTIFAVMYLKHVHPDN